MEIHRRAEARARAEHQVSECKLRPRKFGSVERCQTDLEEAEAREAHFKDLLERQEVFDKDIAEEMIEQHE